MLSGSEKITKKMRLVDAESARDLFLLHAQQLRQHRRDWQRQQRAASAAPQLKDAVASAASSVALQQPSQLLELCLAFLHEADDDEATILALAKVLCTPDGHGRVSLHQITAFLSRYTDKPTVAEEESDGAEETEQKEKEQEKEKEKEEEKEEAAESEGDDGEDSVSSSSTAKWKGGGAAAALLDVKADLLEVPRPAKLVPPPAPEPEPTYVSEWLSNAGLKKLCDGFEEQGLTEESDLRPPLFNPVRHIAF